MMPAASGASLDAVSTYHAPLRVSVAFLVLTYAFLYFQSLSKYYVMTKEKKEGKAVNLTKIKYFGGSNDRLVLTGDRTAGNLVEQSVPFLASLWLCAVFYSPAYAARMGWGWLMSRIIYPVAFHLGFPYILLSTVPGYGFIFALIWPLAGQAWK